MYRRRTKSRKLLTFLLIAVPVLAAGYCAAGFIVGMKAEAVYRQFISRFSGTDTPGLSLECQRYQRGIFSSDAETLVTVRKTAGTPEQEFKFTLKHFVRHGPAAFVDKSYTGSGVIPVQAVMETRIVTGPETQEQLNRIYEEIPELKSSEHFTIIHLKGGIESWLTVPAFKMERQGESPLLLNWEGLSAHVVVSEEMKEANGTISAPGLALESHEGKLGVRGVECTLSASAGAKEIYRGESSFRVAHVEFNASSPQAAANMSMDSLSLSAVSEPAGETVNCSINAHFEKSAVGARSFGPFAFDMEARKLDAAALAKFSREMWALQNSAPALPAEEVPNLVLAKYMDLAAGLLDGSPEIELKKLHLATDKGDFKARAMLAFAKSGAQFLENPLLILNAISASAELSIAEPLLEDALDNYYLDSLQKEPAQDEPRDREPAELAREMRKEQLVDLVSGKFLVKEGAVYKSAAVYKAGRIILNGRGFNLAELFSGK